MLFNWFVNALRWGNIQGDIDDQEDLIDLLDSKLDESELGVPDGVATLDSNGLVPPDQIPALALERISVVADETARFALTTDDVQNGDVVKQTDTGNVYVVSDDTNLGNSSGYVQIFSASAAPVDSVFGRIGIVTAQASDYDASQVDNDSGVSGSTVAAALDTLDSGKASASHTHGASDITSGTLAVVRGGTGAGDVGAARANLSVYSQAESDSAFAPISHSHSASDITSGTLAIERGGTNAGTAADARTNLDVYSKAEVDALTPTPGAHTHDASDIDSGVLAHEQGGLEADVSAYSGLVKINGGATSQATPGTDYYAPGSTDVAVTDGGTGASSEAGARTNLSVYSISEVDSALSGKASTSHVHSATDITSGTLGVTRGGTGAGNVTAARTNLGAQAQDDILDDISALSYSGNASKVYAVNSAADNTEFRTINEVPTSGAADGKVLGHASGAPAWVLPSPSLPFGYWRGTDALTSDGFVTWNNSKLSPGGIITLYSDTGFQVSVDGTYEVNWFLRGFSAPTSSRSFQLYKNGSLYEETYTYTGTSGTSSLCGTAMLELGNTDRVEIYFDETGAAEVPSTDGNYFTIKRIGDVV